MAALHQKYMCYQMMSVSGLPSTNYLYEGDDVKGGGELVVDELRPDARQLLQTHFPLITQLYCPDEITIHGNQYKPGCALIQSYGDDGFPNFKWLDQIYIINQEKLLVVRDIEITDVVLHINAYQVQVRDALSLISINDLLLTMPLSLHFINDKACISNKYGISSLRL